MFTNQINGRNDPSLPVSYSGIPNGGTTRFSARSVIKTALHESYGLFVQMEKKLLEHSSGNLKDEATRYHLAVGLGNKGNILPKIVFEIKTDPQLCSLVTPIEQCMEHLEKFPSEQSV